MKKYLVITNNENEIFELIKNVENIIDLTKFNLED